MALCISWYIHKKWGWLPELLKALSSCAILALPGVSAIYTVESPILNAVQLKRNNIAFKHSCCIYCSILTRKDKILQLRLCELYLKRDPSVCCEAGWMRFNIFVLPCLAMWCKDGHPAGRLWPLIWHSVYDQWHVVLHSLPIYDSVHHLFTLFNAAKEKVVKWALLLCHSLKSRIHQVC